jgi:orotidine-5'-phosphate decarboxylase
MAELVVALDVESGGAALELVDRLPGLRWAKVGPMLFLRDGEIPHAVTGAVRAAERMGIDLATVHALGGPEMVRAAREACDRMKLVAVTVLTSHTPEGYWALVGAGHTGSLASEAARLGRVAVEAGAHGVVSSPLEVAAVRTTLGPEPLIVVPGIRPVGAPAGDQRRTATPQEAVEAGATHLVVGRPITGATDPALVYEGMTGALR